MKQIAPFGSFVPALLGGVVLTLVLVGLFAFSLFIVLPILVIMGAVGAYYYWRYSRSMMTSSVGEIGTALQSIDQGSQGLVRFDRQMQSGGMAFRTHVNLPCLSQTPVFAGDAVVVVSVQGRDIHIKKLED